MLDLQENMGRINKKITNFIHILQDYYKREKKGKCNFRLLIDEIKESQKVHLLRLFLKH